MTTKDTTQINSNTQNLFVTAQALKYHHIKSIIERIFFLITFPIWLSFILLLIPFVAFFLGRPTIISQKRVGKDKNVFKMYKFRTFKGDIDPQLTKDAIKHLTPFGKFMRKWRLDEILQFFNILKGDMSLIGPRPERTFIFKKYCQRNPKYSQRTVVRPGITGWATVNLRKLKQREVILEYDLFYITSPSIKLDLMIVLKTFPALIKGLPYMSNKKTD